MNKLKTEEKKTRVWKTSRGFKWCRTSL